MLAHLHAFKNHECIYSNTYVNNVCLYFKHQNQQDTFKGYRNAPIISIVPCFKEIRLARPQPKKEKKQINISIMNKPLTDTLFTTRLAF